MYKEFMEAATDEQQRNQWKDLYNKGYYGSEIYFGNYMGADGIFHRTTFVFSRNCDKRKEVES